MGFSMIIIHFISSLLMATAFAQESHQQDQSQSQEVSREVAQTPKVGNISYEDQERVRSRVQTLDLTSLAFGPSWGSDVNNSDLFYSLHVGRNWEVNPNAEVRASLDGAIASTNEGLWLSGTVGAGWLMTTDDISPVLGAEFGYGYAHVDGLPDPAGFVLGGFAGVRLFRTATTQMSVEGFFQTILKYENPVMAGLRVGILF